MHYERYCALSTTFIQKRAPSCRGWASASGAFHTPQHGLDGAWSAAGCNLLAVDAMAGTILQGQASPLLGPSTPQIITACCCIMIIFCCLLRSSPGNLVAGPELVKLKRFRQQAHDRMPPRSVWHLCFWAVIHSD